MFTASTTDYSLFNIRQNGPGNILTVQDAATDIFVIKDGRRFEFTGNTTTTGDYEIAGYIYATTSSSTAFYIGANDGGPPISSKHS